MKGRPGLLLLIALLLLPAGIRYGRVALFCKESPPAFFVAKAEMVWVELGEGFADPGVHQFIDGTTIGDVIGMTLAGKRALGQRSVPSNSPLKSGELLSVAVQDSEIIEIDRAWMKAAQRMVLGIPLRPETMAADDWLALPGIGPQLAARIQADRQKNGDFSCFRELERVSGIGPQRLAAWEQYFSVTSTGLK